MSVAMKWFEELDEELAGYVREIVHLEDPSPLQLEEVPDLAESFGIDMLELEQAPRERLEAAVADLVERMAKADPRPKFLRENEGIELSPRLRVFYEEGEHQEHQHAYLDGTEYAPFELYVDFERIGMLINPDFTGETIGDHYVEFANLLPSPEGDPDDCYAHLAIDPQATTVYLMEPSGEPELIAADLDAFIARLKR